MSLSLEYFLLVFIASCGILQGVFAYRKLVGLQFLPGALSGYIFSAVAVAGSFIWRDLAGPVARLWARRRHDRD